MKRINQQLIAEKLNISRPTVSRCFTNHPGINPVTRARVFKLASELGYQHLEMRTTTSDKQQPDPKTIGVLFCADTSQQNYGEHGSPGVRLFAGISEFAQIHKLNTELHYVDWRETSIKDSSYRKIKALQRRTWDGLMLINAFPRNIVKELQIRSPMVSLVEQYERGSYNCVDVDHYKGVSLLMNRLFELGHRRIGFFNLDVYGIEVEWAFRRFTAYVEEMVRADLPVTKEDVVNIYPALRLDRQQSFKYAMKRVDNGVTAWVCAADHQAYELMAALKSCEYRVPEDVSLTGFDGIPKPEAADKSLTTVAIPYHEIGFTGAKRLVDLINKRSGLAQHILVECHLHAGQTVASLRRHPQKAQNLRA